MHRTNVNVVDLAFPIETSRTGGVTTLARVRRSNREMTPLRPRPSDYVPETTSPYTGEYPSFPSRASSANPQDPDPSLRNRRAPVYPSSSLARQPQPDYDSRPAANEPSRGSGSARSGALVNQAPYGSSKTCSTVVYPPRGTMTQSSSGAGREAYGSASSARSRPSASENPVSGQSFPSAPEILRRACQQLEPVRPRVLLRRLGGPFTKLHPVMDLPDRLVEEENLPLVQRLIYRPMTIRGGIFQPDYSLHPKRFLR